MKDRGYPEEEHVRRLARRNDEIAVEVEAMMRGEEPESITVDGKQFDNKAWLLAESRQLDRRIRRFMIDDG